MIDHFNFWRFWGGRGRGIALFLPWVHNPKNAMVNRVKLFPFIPILIRINIFSLQQNKFIYIYISLLENLNVFLNPFFNSLFFFFARQAVIFYWIVLLFKKAIARFRFNFMNSLCEIVNKIWWSSCHKSCTINKVDFLRYSYNTSITIFINFYNFFFYWNRKRFVLFCVLPKTFKVSLQLFC